MNFWHLNDNKNSKMAIFDDSLQRGVTYQELYLECNNLLKDTNLKDKKIIFVFSDNSYLSILVYLSMLRGGHAVFLGDGTMDISLKANLVKIYLPHHIWSINSSDCFEGYQQFTGYFNLKCYKIKVNDNTPIHPDLALLLSTSGTTGSPKFVRLSYKNIQVNAKSIVKYLEIESDEMAITTLPIHYSYGISILHSHLLADASLVCTNHSIVTKQFWTLFKQHSCTSISGVPFTYQVLDRLRFERMRLPSLRTLTQAGGRLDNNRIRKYSEYATNENIRFFVMYGQTEASPRISYVPSHVLPEKIGSIGVPVPGGELSIWNDEKEITDPGVEGALFYRGENVMMGYAQRRADLSKGDEMDGVLNTGDIAYRDEDGFFFLTGRKKRFLKIYGLRLNLDDVEEAIEAYLSKPVACFGSDDKLSISVEIESPTNLKNTIDYTASLYHLHHSCIHAECLDNLPRKSSGKKDYTAIERNQTQ